MSAPRIHELEKLAKEVHGPATRVSIVAYPPSVRVYNQFSGGDLIVIRTDKAVKQHEALRALRTLLQALKQEKAA